jgi:hypothetical protein
MTRRRILLLTVLLTGCTEAPLIKIVDKHDTVFDNKLKLSGKVCTSDPSDMIFPLKVLFVIDTSQSMNVNDPISTTEPDPLLQTRRSRSITEVIQYFIDLKTPVGNIPVYCSTGVAGCEKGGTSCAVCGADHMCVGPDCVANSTFKGSTPCPPAGVTNGTCVALCKCASGSQSCACTPDALGNSDCSPAGVCAATDQCQGGICGKNRDPGVEFAIMRFGSAKQVLTKNRAGKEGFTNDIKELVSTLPQINNGGSVTDYEGALSEAFKVLYSDMHDSRQANIAAVARSKYVVVFLSDGQPDPRINDQDDWKTVPSSLIGDLIGDPNNTQFITEYNVSTRILRRVQDIMGLKSLFHIGDIKFHTAYLADETAPSWTQDDATNLLQQMSAVGKGTFRNIQNGEEINFLRHVDFSSLRRVFRMKNLFATNLNARITSGALTVDSDGDGLDDDTERTAGTSPVRVDTDGDGYSDTVEHFFRASGWDPLNPFDADCSLKAYDTDGDGIPDDTDGDGLADCEERFLGTSRDLFDSDADGVPDGIEVKFGTNAVVVDVEDDLDFDGMPNGDEIRLHTDPRSDESAFRSRISYRYQIDQVGSGLEVVGRRCLEDKECPSGADCRAGYCRCTTDDGCNSGKVCQKDTDCTLAGERCDNLKCAGKGWTCQLPANAPEGTEKYCAATRNITCYQYNVENISLVTTQPASPGGSEGWNTINLYFGQVPFDNPMDYGLFSMACIRARYLDSGPNAGAKLPADGRLEIPETAWHDPRDLTRGYTATATDATGKEVCGVNPTGGGNLYCNAGDPCVNASKNRCGLVRCVCPDGKEGACSTAK